MGSGAVDREGHGGVRGEADVQGVPRWGILEGEKLRGRGKQAHFLADRTADAGQPLRYLPLAHHHVEVKAVIISFITYGFLKPQYFVRPTPTQAIPLQSQRSTLRRALHDPQAKGQLGAGTIVLEGKGTDLQGRMLLTDEASGKRAHSK